jgi:hypothetical protein
MNLRLSNAAFRKLLASTLAAVTFVCFAPAQDSKPALSKGAPLFEVDLRKFGYDNSGNTRRLQKFVDFTDAGHLAVAWLTLDDPILADKTGPLTARPAHLHALILDATNGQKVGVQAWPTPSTPVRFLGARDGRFLTCTGNVLRLFSPQFEVIREQDLQNDRGCLGQRPGWGISPSRRSLLLSSFLGREEGYQYSLLDAETFSLIARWSEKPLIESISDHWLLMRCGKKGEACIRRLDKPWQVFQPTGEDQPDDFTSRAARFVNDDTLVGGRHKMLVGTVDGVQSFQVELPKDRTVESPVTSIKGERFAVIEDRERGLTSRPLDMYALASNDRAVVYNTADHRAIYAVRIKGVSPWIPWEDHVNKLALSPDETLLAVITDAILKVYRLPEGQAARR